MKGKSVVLVLLAVIALSLVLLGLAPHKMQPGELQQYLDRLEKPSTAPESMAFIECQASKLAQQLSPNPREQREFVDQLVDWYSLSHNLDVLLIYNPGGFGGGAMHIDPEWPSVLEGIQTYLTEKWGLTSNIVEYTRARYSALGFTKAIRDIRDEYRTAAPLLAARLGFLLKYQPSLRIIVTGRSFGAAFSNEVMRLLPDENRLYSIQAGRPPGYAPSAAQHDRTLVIRSNGDQPDSWSKGDLWTIIQANLGRLPTRTPPKEGSMQILSWYLRMPGHAYSWDFPTVRSSICAFLDTQFIN